MTAGEMHDRTDDDEVARITKLEDSGHTVHCAKRMVWGDGECTCPGDGTGSPYHTMNPPPGGWVRGIVEDAPFTVGQALRKLRRHAGLTMGEASRALGIRVALYSAMEASRTQFSPHRRILTDDESRARGISMVVAYERAISMAGVYERLCLRVECEYQPGDPVIVTGFGERGQEVRGYFIRRFLDDCPDEGQGMCDAAVCCDGQVWEAPSSGTRRWE